MTHSSVLCLLLAVLGADVQDGTHAGEFVVEHPTLLNLGFEWQIRGDANRNATVAVEFRAVGESDWRQALPLVRIGGENVYRRRENLDYTVPDGFAGSILNLRPGTEYECRFHLTDPDGASGQTEHTVRVKTRSEPQPSREGSHAARLPPRLSGPAPGAQLHKPLAGLLRRGPGRLERRLGTAGEAGRYDPDACRPLQARAAELRGPDDDALRWHDVADVEGDAREADHDQGGRRRRGDLRRRPAITGCSTSWRRGTTSSTG